jgi:hypothetical protein
VNGGEVSDEGEESLEDLELYVYTLRHAAVHSQDRREGDGAQGDEALERAEGNGDNLGICGCAAHEGGENEVFCHLS